MNPTKTFVYDTIHDSPATVQYQFYCTHCEGWRTLVQRPHVGDMVKCPECGRKTHISTMVGPQ